jgi:Dipeptidyl aminopeptidases/acylaminoacyl-peptidases
MHKFTLPMFALLLLTLPVRADDKPKGDEKLAPAKRIEMKKYDFKDAGKEMEYAVFVPSKYDKAKKTPLIFALHGLYSNPRQILSYKGFADLAEKHGYILAAPMGYNPRGWYGQVTRVGRQNGDPDNLAELSEKDVMNVFEIVRKDYNIDPDRTYLMGHSMGGGGTFHIAMKHPEHWAALAPIAPAIFHPVKDLEKIKNIPIILVQGDKDDLVRVERVRPWADKMKELKMTYEYVEVAGGNHINVAMDKLPQIFEFFEAHPKKK